MYKEENEHKKELLIEKWYDLHRRKETEIRKYGQPFSSTETNLEL